jgi:hypothetical protein
MPSPAITQRPLIQRDCNIAGVNARPFFKKLRYKILSEFLLKLSHGTAVDGNDRDVIQGDLCCPKSLLGYLNHVFKYPGVWGRAPCKYTAR